MKKIIIFSLSLACLYPTHPMQASDTESTAIDSQSSNEEAMRHHRLVRTQTFLNFLEKAKNGSEKDMHNFIAYTLNWMAELEKSDHAADQELFKQLYTIMNPIIQKINNAPSQDA